MICKIRHYRAIFLIRRCRGRLKRAPEGARRRKAGPSVPPPPGPFGPLLPSSRLRASVCIHSGARIGYTPHLTPGGALHNLRPSHPQASEARAPPTVAAIPNRRIEGKYEILQKIREGGMGAIYKVRHRLLDEVRVIKLMRPQFAGE